MESTMTDASGATVPLERPRGLIVRFWGWDGKPENINVTREALPALVGVDYCELHDSGAWVTATMVGTGQIQMVRLNNRVTSVSVDDPDVSGE